MTLANPKHFTDREAALAAYDALWQPETTQRILNIEGISGNGKTTLLWYIAHHYDQSDRPRLVVDLAVESWRFQDHALLDYLVDGFKPYLPRNADEDYGKQAAQLDAEAAAIRRSALQVEINQHASAGGQITHSPITVTAEMNIRLAEHRRATRSQLTRTLMRLLQPLARRECVLLLDTYELVQQNSDGDFRSWLEEGLVESILVSLPAWRVVVAGRENLPYRADRHRQQRLPHWTRAEGDQFLGSYRLANAPLQAAIFEHCQGHPLLTDLAREVWTQGAAAQIPLTPADLSQDVDEEAGVRWLQKLLLERLKEPLKSGLEIAAMLRHLSLEALNALLPEDNQLTRAHYRQLLTFSFVQRPTGQPAAVHDLVRQTQDAWYRKQEPRLYQATHQKALQYYTQLPPEMPPDDKLPDLLYQKAVWPTVIICFIFSGI